MPNKWDIYSELRTIAADSFQNAGCLVEEEKRRRECASVDIEESKLESILKNSLNWNEPTAHQSYFCCHVISSLQLICNAPSPWLLLIPHYLLTASFTFIYKTLSYLPSRILEVKLERWVSKMVVLLIYLNIYLKSVDGLVNISFSGEIVLFLSMQICWPFCKSWTM